MVEVTPMEVKSAGKSGFSRQEMFSSKNTFVWLRKMNNLIVNSQPAKCTLTQFLSAHWWENKTGGKANLSCSKIQQEIIVTDSVTQNRYCGLLLFGSFKWTGINQPHTFFLSLLPFILHVFITYQYVSTQVFSWHWKIKLTHCNVMNSKLEIPSRVKSSELLKSWVLNF